MIQNFYPEPGRSCSEEAVLARVRLLLFENSSFWPDKQQKTEKDQHRSVCNIYNIHQGVAVTHHFPYLFSVKHARYPEDYAYRQSEQHQHYA